MKTFSFSAIVLLLKILSIVILSASAQVFAKVGSNSVSIQEIQTRGGIPNLLRKAAAADGRTIRVAYLGGSITEAAGWRVKTLAGFKTRFPGVNWVDINAGVGGTGSDLGVFRLRKQVLDEKPDLLFVEFAVNDGCNGNTQKAMEGIVRQTWEDNPEIDIIFVYTANQALLNDIKSGTTSCVIGNMEAVANHYAIPSIHFGVEVQRLITAGEVVWKAPANTGQIIFTYDGVHPYDAGHSIYAEIVKQGFDEFEKAPALTVPSPHNPGTPLNANHWAAAIMVPVREDMLGGTWHKLSGGTNGNALAKRFDRWVPHIWQTNTPGSSLSLQFRGEVVGLFDILGPEGCQIKWKVDNGSENIRVRFDQYCKNTRTHYFFPSTGLAKDALHTFTATLDAEGPDKRALLNDAGKADFDANPQKYAPKVWSVGVVLLVGEEVDTSLLTYTITYDANGASGGSAPSIQTKPHGVELPLAAQGDLVRNGYTFSGWNTMADGSGTSYPPGGSYTINAIVTFYAIWTPLARTLRIMPMGDSNTAGAGSFTGAKGGWRAPLYTHLMNSGFNFDFVGAKTTNGDTCPYPNHWGQGGWQISKTPGTINGRSYVSIQGENRSGLYEEMSDAISTTYFSNDTLTTRNIILLQIGINDILHQVVDNAYGSFNSDAGNNGQGEGQEWVAEGMIVRLQALLRLIDSLATDRNLRIKVILGTLCPLTTAWTGDPVSSVLINEVVEYNNFISSTIPPMAFSSISVNIVDQYNATVGKLADGLHPNSAGYSAMAQVWFSAIGASTTCTVTFDAQGGTVPSPANKSVSPGSAYGTLATTTRTGYTFAGWWINPGGMGSQVTADALVSFASNHTLYAWWMTVPPVGGEVTETFDTEATTTANGWKGNGNKTSPNNYGWADTDEVLGTGTGGAAGGVFSRRIDFSYFADTKIGRFDRTDTLSLSGNFRLANDNFDGAFYLGYFDVANPNASNFVGIMFKEPIPTTSNPFRGVASVNGSSNTSDFNLNQNERIDFVLTWTGTADGSGTLSGTLTGQNVNVSVPAGTGAFTAFGLLNGGMSNSSEKTGNCYFDNLTYRKVNSTATYIVSYNANGGTGTISDATKTHDVVLTLSDGSGFTRTGYTFSGWNTSADGSGTSYDASGTYTVNADVTLYAIWTVVTTVDQVVYDRIGIYPNPTSDKVYFENVPEESRILFFDISGRNLLVKNASEIKDGLSWQSFEAGFYIIRIMQEQKNIQTIKVLKN